MACSSVLVAGRRTHEPTRLPSRGDAHLEALFVERGPSSLIVSSS
jgi:hypothetical protein